MVTFVLTILCSESTRQLDVQFRGSWMLPPHIHLVENWNIGLSTIIVVILLTIVGQGYYLCK